MGYPIFPQEGYPYHLLIMFLEGKTIPGNRSEFSELVKLCDIFIEHSVILRSK